MHYDGLRAQTPRHRHSLDAHCGYDDMVRVTIRVIRRAIDTCLRQHGHVRLIIAAGNHDEASSVMLRQSFPSMRTRSV